MCQGKNITVILLNEHNIKITHTDILLHLKKIACLAFLQG